ncbi:putative bifunctional diguanylate cyclase/phosphodiesterase [Celerinatantimonas yamalensis]|uniref:EAL domain-containing protein n=1 Tax=Celerinatantimonas yamalensis TaxID=559956 RepID=A0ABW9G9A9_9GAMM
MAESRCVGEKIGDYFQDRGLSARVLKARTILAGGLANQSSDQFFSRFCELFIYLSQADSASIALVEMPLEHDDKQLCFIDHAPRIQALHRSFYRLQLSQTPFSTEQMLVDLSAPRFAAFVAQYVTPARWAWSIPITADGVTIGYFSVHFQRVVDASELIAMLAPFRLRLTQELQGVKRNIFAFLGQQSNFCSAGLLVSDSKWHVLQVNDSYCQQSGFSREELLYRTLPEIMPGLVESYDHDSIRWQGEFNRTHKDGRSYQQQETMMAIGPGSEPAFYLIRSDVLSASSVPNEQVYQLAFYDELTGLMNRRKLLLELNKAFTLAQQRAEIGALLFIDLDRFKSINDSLGHDVGDWILIQVAKRLANIVRGDDIIARLGGDEFVLLLTQLGVNPTSAEHQAYLVGERLIRDITQPFQYQKQLLHLGASVGISLFPGKGQSPEDLLRQADTAMYHAKSNGRQSVCFFEQGMQYQAEHRLQVYSQLRQAIDKEQFCLYFQPQHLTENNALIGIEALVRWQPPGRALILPSQFIAFAQESDLIVEIGRWVLEQACSSFVRWQSQGLTVAKLSVNISAREFTQSNFVDMVQSVIQETQMDPRHLQLELTESILAVDVENAISKMNELKAFGVRFSVDDFGTGYSSLTYLKRLPINELKVDRSFVRDVPHDQQNMAIIEAIIALAKHLDFQVTAEGVETHPQLDFLRRQGCLCYQGFLVSKPLALAATTRYLRRHQPSNV